MLLLFLSGGYLFIVGYAIYTQPNILNVFLPIIGVAADDYRFMVKLIVALWTLAALSFVVAIWLWRRLSRIAKRRASQSN
jgi:hypothetical protein